VRHAAPMRVLFTTWAWPSHYFPQVPLAWALRCAGHEVRMTSQPELLTTMLNSGLPAFTVGRDVDVAGIFRAANGRVRAATRPATAGTHRRRAETIADRLMPGSLGRTELMRLRAVLTLRDHEAEAISLYREVRAARPAGRETNLSLYGEIAETMVPDLLEFGRWWRPDLVVYDPISYAGPIVARLLGVPAVRHLFGPDVTYFGVGSEVACLRPLLDRLGLADVDLLGDATVDPCPPSLQFAPELVPVPRLGMRYVPYNGLSAVPDWVCRDPERPRICLTWGTSTARLVGDDGFVPESLLHGCAKLAAERGAELVLAITAAQRPLLPELPAGVQVAESVPLQVLLPTCAAVVHQGGAGTMLTALLSGLPQLVLTQLPDQAANAHNLLAAGAARTMATAAADAAAVFEAGWDLLDDPAYRAAAQRLGQEIADQPAPADLVEPLRALAGG
jgi:UDP:flavonoid glycosyltransferase YjiC (YdhE family)